VTSTPETPTADPLPAPLHLARMADDLSTERLASGARDNLGGIFLERVFGLGLIVALPLLLAPAALGSYYEAMALLTLATIVAMIGLDVGLVRATALSAERGRFGQIRGQLRAAFLVNAGWSTLVAATLWTIAPACAGWLDEPRLSGALRVGAVGIPFLTLSTLLVAPGKGLKRMRDQVLVIQVVHPAVHLVAAICLIAAGQALAGAVGAFAVGAVAALLFFRLGLPAPERPARGTGARLVRFSLPVAGMALVDMALLLIDTLLLGVFRGPAEVAVYGLVVRLTAVAMAVLFAMIQIFGPFVTQLIQRDDRSGLESVLRTATRWTVLLSAPALALLAVEGDGVLNLLHQHSSSGGEAVVILSAAFLVDSLTGPVGHVLTMSGRSGLNFATSTAALVVNIGLNVLLIPRWGMRGAALSWALVIVALNVARVMQVRALFSIHPFSRSLLKPIVAAGVGALGAVVTMQAARAWGPADQVVGLVAAALVFALLYLGSLRAVGVEPEDAVLAHTLLGRRRTRP
jgi:O-antigen/teichoic acid export membrane protein